MEADLITYVRNSDTDYWHWIKECPQYPNTDVECMISTGPISKAELCPECCKLDLDLRDYSQQVSESNENQ